MPKLLCQFSNERLLEQIREWLEDLGDCGRRTGRAQMFFRASAATGLPEARLRTLFYRKCDPGAREYLIIQARWKQLAIDRDIGAARVKQNELMGRIHDFDAAAETAAEDARRVRRPLP